MEEKKPEFEVRFVPKLSMYREYVWKMTSPLVYLCFLAVDIALAYYMYVQLHGIHALWSYPIIWVAAAYMILWPFIRQELSARKNLSRIKKVCGGKLPEIIISFGSNIEMQEGENHFSSFRYDQIVKMVRMKHSYALMLDKEIGILVPVNGFTVGSAEQLPNFLREKCPNIRIKT